MINQRRAFIIGIKSIKLTKKEKFFLKKYKPWGVILFERNIKSLNQTKKLTDQIKKIFNDKKYPILIDQEGGKVDRLKKIINTSFFTSEFFGNLYLKDIKKFKSYYTIFIKNTCYLLHQIGVNINTVPVLDLKRKNTSKIIGTRSFGSDPKTIQKIGNFCIKKFHSNKIASVIKHIPGHGSAKVDSHKFTPLVKNTLKELNSSEFKPFKNTNSFFAMTAHIVYQKIDNQNTATHSKKIINIIRNKIKFKNLIITDDISMKGLKFSLKINTLKAFNAGCNIVLHCNGKYNEMITVGANSPIIDNFIIKKTSQFYKFLG